MISSQFGGDPCSRALRMMTQIWSIPRGAFAIGRKSRFWRVELIRIFRDAALWPAWPPQSHRSDCLDMPPRSRFQPRRGDRSCSRIFGCSMESRAPCAKGCVCSLKAIGSKPSRGQPGGAGWFAGDRLRRPGSHARPDRRALAFSVCRPSALNFANRGCRLHSFGCRRRG